MYNSRDVCATNDYCCTSKGRIYYGEHTSSQVGREPVCVDSLVAGAATSTLSRAEWSGGYCVRRLGTGERCNTQKPLPSSIVPTVPLVHPSNL